MATSYSFDAYEVEVQRTDKNADGSPKMWNGFSDGPVPERYATLFFDAKDWAGGANFTVTDVGTCTKTMLDIAGGGVAFATGAIENDGISVQHGKGTSGSAGEWVLPAAGKNVYWEMTVSIDDQTQSDVFIGLAQTDTAITTTLPTNLIGFLKVDGSTDMVPTTKNASGTSTTTGAVTMGTSTYKKYGFKVTGNTKVEFYVDDTLVATHTTNIPLTELRPSWEVLTGEANACTLNWKGTLKVAAEL